MERLTFAKDALFTSRSTSSLLPTPALEIWTEPRTEEPCWLERSDGPPTSGEPDGGSAGVVGVVVVVVVVGVVIVVVVVVPLGLTVIVPVISGPWTVQ